MMERPNREASRVSYDVFISYSTPNRFTADAARAAFERAGVTVWMATEAIREGSDWASMIPPAIDASKLVVLILSTAASTSVQVAREIHLAMRSRKRVIPYRVDAAQPSGALQYFLAGVHRIDANPEEPNARIGDLLERTRRALADLSDSKTAPQAVATIPTNVPPEARELIGRDDDVMEIAKLLDGRRLVTVVGPGGAGKTSVALEVARAVMTRFPDGVWYVELAPIGDGTLIGSTLEAALPQDPASKALLVVDNCEHVLEPVARAVAAALDARSRLSVLTTSREPLRLKDETVYHLALLPVPRAGGAAPSIAELNASAAARLLLERASAFGTSNLDADSERRAIGDICRRLDGLPLALELAAARAGSLSFEQIASALDQRFKLLSRAARDATPHHRTLSALIDWSFDLLEASERDVLVRLGAFPGRFTLADLESSVCDDVERFALLDIVETLIERSLVVARGAAAGERQYDLLESMRAYLRRRLDDEDRFASLAVKIARRGAEQARAVARRDERSMRLEAALDNVRFALAWYAGETADADVASELVVALNDAWIESGRWLEGRHWAEQLLSSSRQLSAERRLALLMTAAAISGWMGDYPKQVELLSEALTHEADDRRTRARIANGLAVARYHLGEYDVAFDLWAQSERLLEGEGLAVQSAMVAHNLALIEQLVRRNYDSAVTRCEKAYRTFTEAKHPLHAALSLRVIAEIALVRGDLSRARAEAVRSLELIAPLGNAQYVADAHLRLAKIDVASGSYLSAALHLREALTTYCEELGDELADCALGAASLSFELGDRLAAAKLLAAFRNSERSAAVPLLESDLKLAASLQTRLVEALSAGAVEAAIESASTWSRAVVAAEVLRATDTFITSAFA